MTPIATYAPNPKMPFWARLLGARYWNGDGSVRTKIGEVSYRYRGLAFDVGSYDEPHLHLGLGLFAVFLPLPKSIDRFFAGPNSIERDRYGFSWRWGGGSDLHLHWGRRTKVVWMPWMLRHQRTEYLGSDMCWYDDRMKPASWREPVDVGPEPWSETHPYHYMLDGGEVQHVNATITRRRAFHSREWFGSGPISRLLRRFTPVRRFESVDVSFDQEVGEARGSWKGGCIGTSTNLKPGESPLRALRRMQRERRFR